VARINGYGDAGKPVMILSNIGWATSTGTPLLEAAVPANFSGSTGIFDCEDHSFLIVERAGDPPLKPGWPTGRWAWGDSVKLPFSLLRSAYDEYLRTGRTQTVKWLPGAYPTEHAWSPPK